MAKLTPEIVAELKKKHGSRLFLVEDEEAGDIVFKPATKETWDAFVDAVSPDNTADPTRTLFDECVVFPTMEELQRIHADLPALADAVATEIRNKSGGRKGLESKKL